MVITFDLAKIELRTVAMLAGLGPMQLRSLKIQTSSQALPGRARVSSVGKRLRKPHDASPIPRRTFFGGSYRAGKSRILNYAVQQAIAEEEMLRIASDSKLREAAGLRVHDTNWTPLNRGLSGKDR